MPTSSASPVRPETLLEVRGFGVGYGGAPIVDDLDLTVGNGEIVAVIGPNGSGKSTLLKGLTGRAQVVHGSVLLAGADVTSHREDKLCRLGLGFVPQHKDVFPTLTVEDNLKMGGYLLARSKIGRRVDEVLEVFPALAPMRQRTAVRLSGGERKMLAIGRVLMLEPKLLLLDEPTAGLSPELARHLLHDQLPALVSRGVSILLVEQKALDALTVSDWGYVLVGGGVQISGPARDLLERPDIREVFLGSAARPAVPARANP
ncbi:MAG: livF1 [Acidimicrobiaceae bacterium]|jgi:ABC-type branched-subunit amino acid transport system ATPase component|nr:livF1 [Acidimicrobiaceae bacterium]